MRNFISIWLPHLELNQHQRLIDQTWHERPALLIDRQKNSDIIIDLNDAALKLNLKCGMKLSCALACHDDLMVYKHDAEFKRDILKKLLRHALSYSPQIKAYKNEIIQMDATGCMHLWGGIDLFIQQLISDFNQMGFSVKIGMASNMRASNAFAYRANLNDAIFFDVHQKERQRQALIKLPIVFLDIDTNIVEQLERLGLRQIESLIPIKSAALMKRFGATLLNHFNEALGNQAMAFKSIKFSMPYHVKHDFSEPVTLNQYLQKYVHSLMSELISLLKSDQKAARKYKITIHRPDHSNQSIEIGTSAPNLDIDGLFELFMLHHEQFHAEFGIEQISILGFQIEDFLIDNPAIATQKSPLKNEASQLLDHIGNKIGFGNIMHYIPNPSHLAERSFSTLFHGQLSKNTPIHWPKLNVKRPVKMLKQPFILFDFSFKGFDYQDEHHVIVKKMGPERIMPEWWTSDPLWKEGVRDYYWLTTQKGRQFWVYRNKSGRFFMQGWS